MSVVIYSPGGMEEYLAKLRSILAEAGAVATETAPHLSGLINTLKGRLAQVQLLIIALLEERDLKSILCIKGMLSLVASVIIVRDRSMVEASRSLQPRYIACMDDPLELVSSVIRGMLSKNKVTEDSPGTVLSV